MGLIYIVLSPIFQILVVIAHKVFTSKLGLCSDNEEFFIFIFAFSVKTKQIILEKFEV